MADDFQARFGGNAEGLNATVKDLRSRLKELRDDFLKTENAGKMRQIKEEAKAIRNELQRANKVGKSFFDSLKGQAISITAGFISLHTFLGKISNAFDEASKYAKTHLGVNTNLVKSLELEEIRTTQILAVSNELNAALNIQIALRKTLNALLKTPGQIINNADLESAKKERENLQFQLNALKAGNLPPQAFGFTNSNDAIRLLEKNINRLSKSIGDFQKGEGERITSLFDFSSLDTDKSISDRITLLKSELDTTKRNTDQYKKLKSAIESLQDILNPKNKTKELNITTLPKLEGLPFFEEKPLTENTSNFDFVQKMREELIKSEEEANERRIELLYEYWDKYDEEQLNASQEYREAFSSIAGEFTNDIVAGLVYSTKPFKRNMIDVANAFLVKFGSSGLESLFKGSPVGLFGDVGKVLGKLFADGGYTGYGGVYEPAGVVHKGEVVWSQSDVAAVGGAHIADKMRPTYPNRSRGSGYASGGTVYSGNAASQAVSNSSRGNVIIQPILMIDGEQLYGNLSAPNGGIERYVSRVVAS